MSSCFLELFWSYSIRLDPSPLNFQVVHLAWMIIVFQVNNEVVGGVWTGEPGGPGRQGRGRGRGGGRRRVRGQHCVQVILA